jgi:stage II sporulation protein M
MNPGEKLDRTLKAYVPVLAAVFLAFFLVGTLAPAPVQEEASKAFLFVADTYQGLSGGALFFNILVGNLLASFLVLVSGVLVGIIPVLSIASNGYFLGVLYRQATGPGEYSKAALEVLPHGIFEIPALLVASAYGLWLGVKVLRRVRGKESVPIGFHVVYAMRRYLAVVFPLLVVAAAIETAILVF